MSSAISLPSLDVHEVRRWAEGHGTVLVIAVVAVVVLAALIIGLVGEGAKLVFNVVVGLGMIAGAVLLYGYGDRILSHLGG